MSKTSKRPAAARGHARDANGDPLVVGRWYWVRPLRKVNAHFRHDVVGCVQLEAMFTAMFGLPDGDSDVMTSIALEGPSWDYEWTPCEGPPR